MILRILGVLLLVTIVMAIIFWFISGGPSKITTITKNQPSLVDYLFNGKLSANISSIKLPWQESVSRLGATDISQYVDNTTGGTDDYNYSQDKIDNAKTLGNQSPYNGQITIQESKTNETSVAKEYISIVSAQENLNAIDINGWSIQSAVSGVRLYLPQATTIFTSGTVNKTNNIMFAPGAYANIISGTSPVGTSFRENICSGYLGNLQSFYPHLDIYSCPIPSDALPETANNLRNYGSSCLDYVRNLSPCEFPQNISSTLSPTCRAFVVNTFSYNGCVHMYRDDSKFLHKSWRLYLNSPVELWDNAHDIIRLLDAQGRIVDALTY